MAIKELSALTQSVDSGFLPNTGGSDNKSASVSENNQLPLDGAQFLNRDALAASRNDLRANFQARRLNNALDGDKPTQVLVSPDQARYINKGLDGKDREVKFSIDELIAFSRMDDPREAIFRAALERFGDLPSDRAAIDDYLTEFKNARGGSATISWRQGDEKGENIEIAELKIAIENQIKSEQYRAAYDAAMKNNRRPPVEPKYAVIEGDTKADFFSAMVIDAPTRQAIFSKWLDRNGSPEAKLNFERDKLESNINLRIEEAQKRLKKEFDALKNDNNLYNSFVELKYQNALKDEIDKIVAQTQADFRGQGLGSQIGDVSETVLRGVINNHPLYQYLPDSVKDEMVKFGVGVEKGVIGIAAGVKGAGNFVGDAIEDAVVYGLKSSGIDTSSYEKMVDGQRAERRQFWTELSSINTKQMSQAERAYAEKVERGLYVTPYDLPNKSTTLGQAAPQVALGLATGGESIAAQILISAATQATLAGGETYITSNNRSEAVKAATIAGVQGAIAPVTAKLPLPADLAASALMTYTTGKLQGLDDNKIFESIVTQTALSGGFRARDTVAYLRANKEVVLKTFETTMGESVGKNVRALVEEQGKPLKAQEGGALYRTAGKNANEIRFLQTIKTKEGIQLREISVETYQKVKGNLREVEISNRQFDAANGIRLTADGKITTTERKKLAKNLDSAQGTIEREPRFVTPTTAEFFRKVEIATGLEQIQNIRQQYIISKDKNVGFADVEVDEQKWRIVAHSGRNSKPETSPVPEKRFFKTGTDGFERSTDSEVKILEEFAGKYENNRKVKGKIYLFTERPPCESCTNLVEQFRVMFPNVKIEIASGSYIEKKGGK